MDKRLRELRKAVNTECAKAGCRAVSWEITGGTHQRLVVERNNGSTATIFFSFSPSDGRSTYNALALLRRKLREQTP
jgi:hypothetical protein